ncbi:MAG: aminotransferase class I/II-fold pyridoxal phosphate-dependent enzyme, partial [Anaerolineales bacterium]|nr:aminotransferase class I/II-fold pyridoxal phosphate-dependent enzyme [Anaerolineales bacterium]
HVKSNTDSGIYKPIQQAAVKALETDRGWTASRNAVFQERMDMMVNGLFKVGLDTKRPRATLYLWAKIPDGWNDEGQLDNSERFARAMLDEIGVATAPGSFFGPGGEGFIRFSVTAPTGRIREAMDRLLHWLPEVN